MTKIARFDGNLKAFASEQQTNERTLFGQTAIADDLTSQITAQFLRGWGIVGPSDEPSLQDFNAAMYTHGQLLAYLHQMGIPEFNAAQEYYLGSVTQTGGVIYISLQDGNTGRAPASNPAWWRTLEAPPASATVAGIQRNATQGEVNTGTANNLTVTPATLSGTLGTAAKANLTTGQTDATAGRVLRVADFGLGGSPATDTADPDALQFSCFFRAFNSAKMPTLETFSGIHTQGKSGNSDASQIAWNPTTDKAYTRTRTSAGSWSAWTEFYTTANVGAFMQTLLPSPTKEIAQAALGVAITKEFVSGELTVTASGLISVPHSLGARPKFITAEAVCKIASVGWSVGDVVGIAVSPFVTDTSVTRGIQVAYDPVNVIAKISASALAIMNKTSGAVTGVNASDWRLVLRAYV